ncbi:S-adenosylmethionine-dependent nucleotide dehydratase RSAD2-like [Rhynchophorus ferrugineus]|uniref:S-adenosylmethionine-dependent nucleotide dehydratase RSAD2-like n=1 Tax=Rhynchophorus ferrugineus TaxID=354439 RepID=UPI003FCC9E9F
MFYNTEKMSLLLSKLKIFLNYIFSNFCIVLSKLNKLAFPFKKQEGIVPRSVNYHFTRVCNYSCGFCFHTAKTSYMLNLNDAKMGFDLLKAAGMEKINFSGGEPFFPARGKHLGEMVKYCKKNLKISVSIVSNGSLITERWFEDYGQYIDILAISCDSFHEETNKLIGRGQGKRNHIEKLKKIRCWCSKYNVLFKINTVVNTYNKHENMVDEINELNPIRWKVFQCLLLEGENVGEGALRNAEKFYIDDKSFNDFIYRHKSVKCLVPESNVKMQNSYLILDEYMRFLDCQNGSKIPSKSILDVGVENALKFSGFDEQMFKKRGGIYKWTKEANMLTW